MTNIDLIEAFKVGDVKIKNQSLFMVGI
jgi:hypothetical protein